MLLQASQLRGYLKIKTKPCLARNFFLLFSIFLKVIMESDFLNYKQTILSILNSRIMELQLQIEHIIAPIFVP